MLSFAYQLSIFYFLIKYLFLRNCSNVGNVGAYIFSNIYMYIYIARANTLYKPEPHGNVKDKSMASGFKPTLPSTIDHLKGLLSMSPAHQIYKNSSKVDGPRDLKQCQNIRYVSLRKKCSPL